MEDKQQVAARALDEVVRAQGEIRSAEVRQSMALAVLAETYSVEFDAVVAELAEKTLNPGGDGTPGISEFLTLELGAAMGISQRSALHLVADVLNLKHRHPRLWDAFCSGLIPRWQAGKLADMTSILGCEEALWVDAHLAPKVGRVAFQRLKKLARGLVAAADPELLQRREEQARASRGVFFAPPEAGSTEMYASVGARDAMALDKTLNELACAMGDAGDDRPRDQRRAAALGMLADPASALAWLEDAPARPPGDAVRRRNRGRTVVYVHLAADTVVDRDTGVARIEGFGPLTTHSLPEFLSGSNVTVRPVVDDITIEPVDSYEIPQRIRDAVHRLYPVEVFPFSGLESRSLDLDHIAPYRRGAAWTPGQTGVGKLVPVGRLAHRAKTAEIWRLRRTTYGHFAWASPLGREYTVARDGTAEAATVSGSTRCRPG